MPQKFPCSVCKFNVHSNSKAIQCDICNSWVHLKCTRLSNTEYSDLSNSTDTWFCLTCLSSIFPFNHLEDDTDFYFALYDFNSFPHTCFDQELLKTKCFNPFLEDINSRHLLLNPDIDPDTNIFKDTQNVLSNCVYLSSKEFNNIPVSSADSFSLFHTNIRSLKKNFNDFSEFLSSLNLSFSAFGISETWLDDATKDLYNIPGYSFLSNCRQNKLGGGVGMVSI